MMLEYLLETDGPANDMGRGGPPMKSVEGAAMATDLPSGRCNAKREIHVGTEKKPSKVHKKARRPESRRSQSFCEKN